MKWLLLPLRLLILWQLTVPAFSKFLQYESRVAHFQHDYGIPLPEVMVPVVGAVEVVYVIAVFFGIAGRVLSIPMMFIMLVAIATAGLEFSNLAVLLGSICILVLGTGPLSLWDPEIPWRTRLRAGRAA